MRTKNKNAAFGRYPSCDMVNNAIRFILDGKLDDAISELYYAILKADGYIHSDIEIETYEAKDRAWEKHKSEQR